MSQLSKPGTLTREDIQKSLYWAWVFLAPLGALYLGSIQTLLLTPGHVFYAQDLIPNNIVIGGMVLYLIERFYDLCIRWVSGTKPQSALPVDGGAKGV